MQHTVWCFLVALLCSVQFAKTFDEEGIDPDGNGKSTDTTDAIFRSGTDQPDSKRSGRLSGGMAADIADYPYMAVVTLRAKNTFINSGVVISSVHVLATAFSLLYQNITTITIRVGSNLLQSGGYLFNHSSFKTHSKFSYSDYSNDIAIITIKGSFIGLPNVKPIAIQTNPDFTTDCFILGYRASAPRTLQRGNVKLLTDIECKTKIPRYHASKMCTDLLGIGICATEVSGPLVCNNKLYGIMPAYGSTCGSNLEPNSTYLLTNLRAPSVQNFLASRLMPNICLCEGCN